MNKHLGERVNVKEAQDIFNHEENNNQHIYCFVKGMGNMTRRHFTI